MRKLTDKQQKLIDCYDGDIKKAAKKSKISYGYARQLLTKSNILVAIRNRIDTEIRPAMIASRQDRQIFWSDIMNDKLQLLRDRLRASELLGKSEMDFPNKMEVTGADGGPIKIQVVHFAKANIHNDSGGSPSSK